MKPHSEQDHLCCPHIASGDMDNKKNGMYPKFRWYLYTALATAHTCVLKVETHILRLAFEQRD